MIRYAWRNVIARWQRLVLTVVAVSLGVAVVAGTFVVTDTIAASADSALHRPTRPLDLVIVDRLHPRKGVPISDEEIAEFFEIGLLTPIPDAIVDTVAKIDGVSDVVGVALGGVQLIGPSGRVIADGRTPIARSIDASFAARIVEGTLPTSTTDVVVDRDTARRHHIGVGAPVRVVLPGGTTSAFSVVGVVDDAAFVGNLVVGLEPASARHVLVAEGTVSAIDIRLAPGSDPTAAAATIDQLLGRDYRVLTASTLARLHRDRVRVSGLLAVLRAVMLIAASAALFLGSFVIRTTFTIQLASRTRELTLLRCLGATKGQVHRLITTEAALIGLAGSTVGLGIGVGLATVLGFILRGGALFTVVNSATPQVLARTVIATFVVGVAVTAWSASGAARRSSRVAPIAALRGDAYRTSARSSAARRITAAAAFVGGVGLVVASTRAARPSAATLLAAALALVVSVLLGAPCVARTAGAVLVAAGRRSRGAVLSLAAENGRRAPRHAAATMMPLALAVALITTLTILATSLTAPARDAYHANWNAEVHLSSISNPAHPEFATQLDPAITDKLATIDGIGTIAAIRNTTFAVNGHRVSATGTQAARLATVMNIDITSGSVAELHESDIAISDEAAANYHTPVGATLTIDTPKGTRGFTVRATYRRPTFDANVRDLLTLPYGHVILTETAYLEATGQTGVDTILVASHAERGQLGRMIERALADYPTVRIETDRQFLRRALSQFETSTRLYDSLLGLLAVIALAGIINTLALHVTERRRELALLRAVGLDRHQLRGLVHLEAANTGTLAAVIGVGGLGSPLGWLAARGAHVPYRWPVAALSGLTVATVALATFAAYLPARRASRSAILDNIRTE